jgi:hypothetical protein
MRKRLSHESRNCLGLDYAKFLTSSLLATAPPLRRWAHRAQGRRGRSGASAGCAWLTKLSSGSAVSCSSHLHTAISVVRSANGARRKLDGFCLPATSLPRVGLDHVPFAARSQRHRAPAGTSRPLARSVGVLDSYGQQLDADAGRLCGQRCGPVHSRRLVGGDRSPTGSCTRCSPRVPLPPSS